MFNKIVRTPWLQSDPVVIRINPDEEPPPEVDESEESSDAEESEDESEESSEGGGRGGGGKSSAPAVDEEAINTMLAEIAAKEERAIQKLKDAEVQANIMKQEAENERQQLLDKAKAEIDKAKSEARKVGYEDGLKDGKKKGHDDGVKAAKKEFADKLKDANAKAMKTLQDAKAATSDYFVRAEEDIALIVMLAIEKILPQHFLDVPQVVLPVVREAIKQVRDQKEIKVHVAPDYYDIVLMAKSEFQAMLTDGTAVLEIISDETLGEGDCVVETPNGGVDARLLTQIELMKDAIRSVL